MEPYKVLIVDDDEAIRAMLVLHLCNLGYAVDSARDMAEAVERLEHGVFDLVLTDVRMPGQDGMELLHWIESHLLETGVVMLSGCDDIKLAVRAMQGGALDYIVKPFDLVEVAGTIGRAIGKKHEQIERRRYLASLEAALEHQSGELRSTLNQLQEASQETLEALVTALDARERETHAHSKRVSEYSVHLASEMGVRGAELEVVRQGSMLHDIGKIGVPDRILLKPGSLSAEEWVEMRKHPEIGAWIVSGVESLKQAADIVISHHERFDGTGYPAAKAGLTIPLGARVFAVADCLDAILSDRPYRGGRTSEHAREEIARHAGSQFDPEVTRCFLKTPNSIWERIRETTFASQSVTNDAHVTNPV
jgi:putative nucleotidyltransferase with HDIG domain